MLPGDRSLKLRKGAGDLKHKLSHWRAGGKLPTGALQTRTDFAPGYSGPCPPQATIRTVISSQCSP
jgi:hypothetical protein